MTNNRHYRSEKGFTLVEVAVVVAVSGILFAAFAGSLSVYMKQVEGKAVRTNLDTINQAIQNFLADNGRLPCPAARGAGPDANNFGVEEAGGCAAAPVDTVDNGAGTVRIGVLPVRTLNLPDQYSEDSWGNRYTYAVTKALAVAGTYTPTGGAISIRDSGGNSLITPIDKGHYVVVSHGPDGTGAYNNAGTAPAGGRVCPVGVTLDAENCNNDAIFIKTSIAATIAGAAHYDDYIVFGAQGNSGADSCGDAGMIYGPNHPRRDGQGCLSDLKVNVDGHIGIGQGTVAANRLTVPWVAGDTTATAVFGSINPANDQAAIMADSGSTWGVRATTQTGFSALMGAANGPGIGVDGESINGTGVLGKSFNAVSGLFQTGNIAGTNAAPTLVTKLNALQTANLFEAQDGGGVALMLIDKDGNVGINMTPVVPYKLDVNGEIRSTAALVISDIRLKKDIEPLTDALEKVMQLKGVTFDWIKDTMPKGRQLGMIAQDVEKVFPEAVKTDSEGMKAVNYNDLIAPLVEAIKEQQSQIDSLKQEIETLKAEKK